MPFNHTIKLHRGPLTFLPKPSPRAGSGNQLATGPLAPNARPLGGSTAPRRHLFGIIELIPRAPQAAATVEGVLAAGPEVPDETVVPEQPVEPVVPPMIEEPDTRTSVDAPPTKAPESGGSEPNVTALDIKTIEQEEGVSQSPSTTVPPTGWTVDLERLGASVFGSDALPSEPDSRARLNVERYLPRGRRYVTDENARTAFKESFVAFEKDGQEIWRLMESNLTWWNRLPAYWRQHVPIYDAMSLRIYSGSGHGRLNDLCLRPLQQLREGLVQETRAAEDAADLLDNLKWWVASIVSALNRLPARLDDSPLYRGVRRPEDMAILNKPDVEDTLTIDSLVSTSTAENRAHGGSMLVTIRPLGGGRSRGKDISPCSIHPNEQEVLFPPGTRFRIVARTQNPTEPSEGGDRHSRKCQVVLQELEDEVQEAGTPTIATSPFHDPPIPGSWGYDFY